MDGPDLFWISFDARWVTMYPKNFPELTPNEHLAGLSFMLYFRRVEKVCCRCDLYDVRLPGT